VGRRAKTEVIGIRPGEKLHEEMITEMDSFSTFEFPNHYVISPAVPLWTETDYIKHFKVQKVKTFFNYNSASNDRFLTVEEIREQIRKHVDQTFKVVS
jgi:FlaA1/EpsC-like NDP-sugar epimerase